MKEFEKWYKYPPTKYFNGNIYEGAKLGWKAALEWVLKDCFLTDMGRVDIEGELSGRTEDERV